MHILKAKTADGTYKYALTRVCLFLTFLTFLVTCATALIMITKNPEYDMSNFDKLFSAINVTMGTFSMYLVVKSGVKKYGQEKK